MEKLDDRALKKQLAEKRSKLIHKTAAWEDTVSPALNLRKIKSQGHIDAKNAKTK